MESFKKTSSFFLKEKKDCGFNGVYRTYIHIVQTQKHWCEYHVE
jgi:hypothetical protein